MNKYQNGKKYKIVDVEYKKCYIGSTIQSLSNRMSQHRRNYSNGRDDVKSKLLFDEFGIDNCKVELIEIHPCHSKEELLKREGHYIRTTACVNKVIPGRTKEEYEQYRCQLPQRIDYMKQFAESHKELLKEYQRNRIRDRTEIFRCECGCELRKADKSRHIRTNKHLLYLENNKE